MARISTATDVGIDVNMGFAALVLGGWFGEGGVLITVLGAILLILRGVKVALEIWTETEFSDD